MGKIIMNICASADSFGAYSENCIRRIVKESTLQVIRLTHAKKTWKRL